MRHFPFNQICQAADGKEGRVKRSSNKLGCIEMVLVTICLADIELFTKYVNTLTAGGARGKVKRSTKTLAYIVFVTIHWEDIELFSYVNILTYWWFSRRSQRVSEVVRIPVFRRDHECL